MMAHQRTVTNNSSDKSSNDLAAAQRDPKLDTKIFDFTKRKRWPDLLITELAGVVIFVLNPLGDILYCGEAAKELLGWKDDVVDIKLSDLMHGQSTSVPRKCVAGS